MERSFDYRKTKPVMETEWTRVYKSDQGYVYVSKFMEGDVKVTAESIRAQWPTFSFEQKLDFVQAFAKGGRVTSEDERIMDFLMEAGEPFICMEMAPRLLDHRDRDHVLAFLLDRISDDFEYKGNFVQALGLMKDPRALPALRTKFDGYRERLAASPGSMSPDDCMDYMVCLQALWRISGSQEYKPIIEDALNSPDETVRRTADLILRDRI